MAIKDKIKQIFTLNNILTCYICAIGYGIGYAIPEYLGYSPWICLIPCMIFGTIFYFLGVKVLNSKFFNKSKKRKIIYVAIFYIAYVIIAICSVRILGHDIDNDFLINLAFIIAFQILAFIVEYIRESIKLKKKKN